MSKAGKWFRSFWSSKNSPESPPSKKKKKKTKWFLSNSGGNSGKLENHDGDPLASPYAEGIDANKHAIAVAAATAAVAEAALVAAQAAAEVVRLTSGGRSGRGALGVSVDRRLVLAAVKIQSSFRAYLARRALRALKGLVKLQALVRGHIVRKQSADMLRRMQAMARIQARASAHRSYVPESPYAKKNKISSSYQPGFANPRKYEVRSNSVKNGGSLPKPNHSRSSTNISVDNESSQIPSRWLNHWMEQYALEQNLHETSLESRPVDDERGDKILEIDTWRPHRNRNDRTTPTSQYFSAWNNAGHDHTKIGPKHHKPNPSISSEDLSSVGDRVPPRTADNGPWAHSASCGPAGNVRGPYRFTPARSECSRSSFGDYLVRHPNYMANTESSRAKVRSHSVPKQRMQLEELGSSRDLWEYSDTISERGSFLPVNNRGGSYRYSGQVKSRGTPTCDPGVGFNPVYGRRI